MLMCCFFSLCVNRGPRAHFVHFSLSLAWESIPIPGVCFDLLLCIEKVSIFLPPVGMWPVPNTSPAPCPSLLSQETLVGLEAKQSESLSELIALREALESSRLAGEILKQEQEEVAAALARVCGHLTRWKVVFLEKGLESLVCFWVLSLPTCHTLCIEIVFSSINLVVSLLKPSSAAGDGSVVKSALTALAENLRPFPSTHTR